MRKIACIIIAIGLLPTCYANTYKWQAEIGAPQESGFYKIPLDSGITTKLNANFSDLRIFRDDGQEIPYLLETEQISRTIRVFREYPIERISHYPLGTEVIILNKDKKTINNFSLIIKNFEARKRIKLSGSDDGKMWYTVKERYTLYNANSTSNTHEVKLFDFPSVDYKYLRLLIFDYTTLPINILKAGCYEHKTHHTKLQPLPQPEIHQLDSASKSYVKVEFEHPSYFDQLKIEAEGMVHYNRHVQIAIKDTNKRGFTYFQPIHSFRLNSEAPNVVGFQNFGLKEFYLIIENHDNPPLKITALHPYQLPNYLIAYIEKGKGYQLEFGNKGALPPHYDIAYFRDKVPENPQSITPKELSAAQIMQADEKPKPNRNYWIWAAIIVSIAVMGLVSAKMVREVE